MDEQAIRAIVERIECEARGLRVHHLDGREYRIVPSSMLDELAEALAADPDPAPGMSTDRPCP